MSQETSARQRKTITIHEMVLLYPDLFTASPQFLLIEANLEASLK